MDISFVSVNVVLHFVDLPWFQLLFAYTGLTPCTRFGTVPSLSGGPLHWCVQVQHSWGCFQVSKSVLHIVHTVFLSHLCIYAASQLLHCMWHTAPLCCDCLTWSFGWPVMSSMILGGLNVARISCVLMVISLVTDWRFWSLITCREGKRKWSARER